MFSFFVFINRTAYGSTAHLLNMFLYLLGLLPLTHLMVTLRPTMNITDTGEHSVTMVPTAFVEVRLLSSAELKLKINNSSSCLAHSQGLSWLFLNFVLSQQSLFLTFCMVMVLVMNIYCIAKEVVQISQQVLLNKCRCHAYGMNS